MSRTHISASLYLIQQIKHLQKNHISSIKLIVLLYVSVFRICQQPRGTLCQWLGRSSGGRCICYWFAFLTSILVTKSLSSPVNLHLKPPPKFPQPPAHTQCVTLHLAVILGEMLTLFLFFTYRKPCDLNFSVHITS